MVPDCFTGVALTLGSLASALSSSSLQSPGLLGFHSFSRVPEEAPIVHFPAEQLSQSIHPLKVADRSFLDYTGDAMVPLCYCEPLLSLKRALPGWCMC